MNNDEKIIFGKKTRTQILSDVRKKSFYFIGGFALLLSGAVGLVFIVKENLFVQIGLIVFGVIFIASILMLLPSLRCPLCDSFKRDPGGDFVFPGIEKNTYYCMSCNLSEKQIDEIIDMLKRGVEINKETIARFNKRDL